jgi:iron transport multicopper oxidase
VPTLYSALTTSSAATNPIVYGLNSNPYLVSPNQVVEILLVNHDHRPHPFHLHGHTFQLITRSSSPPPSPLPALPLSFTPSHPRPLRRDTVILPPNGFIAIRFLADNPGVHLCHCHIEFHVEAGMTASIIESPEEMQRTVVIPQDHLEVCRRQGIKTEGNAAGRTGADVLDLRGAVARPDGDVKGAVIGPLVLEGSNGRWTPKTGVDGKWKIGRNV